jgi:hypothetical protein
MKKEQWKILLPDFFVEKQQNFLMSRRFAIKNERIVKVSAKFPSSETFSTKEMGLNLDLKKTCLRSSKTRQKANFGHGCFNGISR